MRHILAVIMAAAMASGAVAVAQQLDEASIVAAIRAGEARKYGHLVSECTAIAGFGSHMAAEGPVRPLGNYALTLAAAQGRIAMMAAEAKRLYRPFAAADVPEELRAGRTVYVSAVPAQPTNNSDSIHVAPPIERIVLKSKVNPAAVAQPQHVDIIPVQWSNLLGGKVDGTSAVATFAYADVRELPAGEFDMVLITTAGERRCKVGTKDRDRLFR